MSRESVDEFGSTKCCTQPEYCLFTLNASNDCHEPLRYPLRLTEIKPHQTLYIVQTIEGEYNMVISN